MCFVHAEDFDSSHCAISVYALMDEGLCNAPDIMLGSLKLRKTLSNNSRFATHQNFHASSLSCIKPAMLLLFQLLAMPRLPQ